MLKIEKYFTNNINVLYVNRYKKFIKSIDDKGKRNLDYKERHHIIPKCVNKELDKDINNKIDLTAREHLIAHKILSKCFIEGTNEYNRLVCALFAMSKLQMNTHRRQDIKLTSREYEKLRIKYSKVRHSMMKIAIKDTKYKNFIGKGKPSTIKGKISITNGVINKYINPNDKIPKGWYIGNTQSIKKNKQLWQNKLKNSWNKNKKNRTGENHPMYGKGYLLEGNKNGRYGVHLKYMNNGKVNKMVKLNEVDNYLNNGWNFGVLRNNVPMKNGIYVYKDDICKLICKKELEQYKQDGWIKGNPKAANKGSKNGAYHTVVMNNGVINKRVKYKDVNTYLEDGWKKGFIKRVSNNVYGAI